MALFTGVSHLEMMIGFEFVGKDWSCARKKIRETSFFAEHIVARCSHFFLIPLSIIAGAFDSLGGIFLGIPMILTAGRFPKLNKYAFEQLYGSGEILAGPFRYLLKTLDPDIKFSFGNEFSIPAGGIGFITHYVLDALTLKAYSFLNSTSFFERHIISRLTYVLLGIACLVTRVVDGIIAIPITLLSLFFLGRVKWLNNIAFRALQVPNIIGDLFLCAMGIIDPSLNQGREVLISSEQSTNKKYS